MGIAYAETYSESAEGVVITRERAIEELASHGMTHTDDLVDFFGCLGDQATYHASDVLAWLGY